MRVKNWKQQKNNLVEINTFQENKINHFRIIKITKKPLPGNIRDQKRTIKLLLLEANI